MNLSLCTSGPFIDKLAGHAAGVGVGLSDTPMVYQQNLVWDGQCVAPYTFGQIRNNTGTPETSDRAILTFGLISASTFKRPRFLLDYEPDPQDNGCEVCFHKDDGTPTEVMYERANVYEIMSHYADSLYGFPRNNWTRFPRTPMDRIMRRLPFLAPCAYWFKGWTAKQYHAEQLAYQERAAKYDRLRDIKPLFTFTYSGGGGPVTVGHCGHMNKSWSFCDEGLLWFAVDTEEQADAAIELCSAERVAALGGYS